MIKVTRDRSTPCPWYWQSHSPLDIIIDSFFKIEENNSKQRAFHVNGCCFVGGKYLVLGHARRGQLPGQLLYLVCPGLPSQCRWKQQGHPPAHCSLLVCASSLQNAPAHSPYLNSAIVTASSLQQADGALYFVTGSPKVKIS